LAVYRRSVSALDAAAAFNPTERINEKTVVRVRTQATGTHTCNISTK
jgi:hypothetical protein